MAAAVGQYGDPSAKGGLALHEGFGHVQEFVGAVAADNAALLQGGVKDFGAACQRTGMRSRRPGAGRAAADLDCRDGAPERGPAGRFDKVAAVCLAFLAQAFHIEKKDSGLLVVSYVADEIAEAQVQLVADAAPAAVAEIALLRVEIAGPDSYCPEPGR